MTDIVDILEKSTHDGWDENAKTTISSSVLVEAKNEIERLREALRKIGFDYVELSHDKVQWLYLEHIKIARKAYQESFNNG